jgi:hypothetical protein
VSSLSLFVFESCLENRLAGLGAFTDATAGVAGICRGSSFSFSEVDDTDRSLCRSRWKMDFIVRLEERRGKVGRKEWATRIGIDHVDQGRSESNFAADFPSESDGGCYST